MIAREDLSKQDTNQNHIVLSSQNQPEEDISSHPKSSETNLLDDNTMETDHLSDSVTQIIIDLSKILNRTIQPEPKPSRIEQSYGPHESAIKSKAKRLKAALTIIANVSHHKTFMETCLMRNTSP